MNAQAIVHEHRAQLAQLRSLADADLASLVSSLDGLSVAEVRDALIVVLPELLAPYEAAAGELAAVTFEDMRMASAARGAFYAETAPLQLTAARAEGTARWAVGALVQDDLDSTLLSRLTGSAARAIFDSSRDTMRLNSERESIRFQRMARPNCCAFCGMLASRGAVYQGRNTASVSHDDCQCIVMPVYPGTPMAELAEVERKQWQQKYVQVSKTSGTDTTDLLAEWRRTHSAS